MRQIIRTVMPLNDGNIDSEGNFHNSDSVNAALEDVMTPAPSSDRCERSDAAAARRRRRGDGRGTGESSDHRGRFRATPPFCCSAPLEKCQTLGVYVGVGRAALLEHDDKKKI